MEDRDLEFGLVALFLILAAAAATSSYNRDSVRVNPVCLDMCGNLGLATVVATEEHCVCGTSGNSREFWLHDYRDAAIE